MPEKALPFPYKMRLCKGEICLHRLVWRYRSIFKDGRD